MYGIALPVSYAFGFRLGLGITGFWWGVFTAVGLMVIAGLMIVSRLDWRAEGQAAQARVQE